MGPTRRTSTSASSRAEVTQICSSASSAAADDAHETSSDASDPVPLGDAAGDADGTRVTAPSRDDAFERSEPEPLQWDNGRPRVQPTGRERGTGRRGD